MYEDTGTAGDGIYDATLTAYLNNSQVGQFTDLGRIFTHSDPQAIGGVNSTTLFHDSSRNTGTFSDPLSPGTENFDGVIDEVAVYGTALSAADVSAHYLAAIPEPATLGLLAAGIFLIPGRRKK